VAVAVLFAVPEDAPDVPAVVSVSEDEETPAVLKAANSLPAVSEDAQETNDVPAVLIVCRADPLPWMKKQPQPFRMPQTRPPCCLPWLIVCPLQIYMMKKRQRMKKRPPCCLPFLRMPQPWPCRSYIYNIMYKQPAAVPEDEETPAVAANVFYICRYLQQNGVFIC